MRERVNVDIHHHLHAIRDVLGIGIHSIPPALQSAEADDADQLAAGMNRTVVMSKPTTG